MPATFAVTVTALGNVPPSIEVADNDTDGITTAVVVAVVDVGATFGAEAERTQVCSLPDSHKPVTGQCSTPVLASAHNSATLPARTERNGVTQPDEGATETNRDRSNRLTEEAFQHNNGADFVADQNCAAPTHLSPDITRLTTPDGASTHTVTALGKRTA